MKPTTRSSILLSRSNGLRRQSTRIKLGFKAEGAVVCTHDPSDSGDDAKGYAARRGVVFEDICEMATGDVNVGCDWALDKAIAIGADYFGWDADGMGVTLKRQVDHSLTNKKIEWFMFKGSEAPQDAMREYDPVDIRDPAKRKTNREALLNRRAQAYMELARRFPQYIQSGERRVH